MVVTDCLNQVVGMITRKDLLGHIVESRLAMIMTQSTSNEDRHNVAAGKQDGPHGIPFASPCCTEENTDIPEEDDDENFNPSTV